MNKNQVRRAGVGTSLQHKTKSSIYQLAKERRLGVRAWKVHGFTPGGPVCVFPRKTEKVARPSDHTLGVSRGHMRCRINEAGVVADGLPVQRRIGMDSPHQRPERCPD